MATTTMAVNHSPPQQIHSSYQTNSVYMPPALKMKQIAIVPGLFRRRNNNKAAAKAGSDAAVCDQLPGSDTRDVPYIGRVSAIRRGQPAPCSSGVIDIASGRDGATVSTLTNGRPEATMKMSEKILQDDDEISPETSDSYDGSVAGIDHLSMREQMWYKNQLYLLEKQKKSSTEDSAHNCRRPNRSSSRYESNDRGIDQYTAGIDKHSDSPNRRYVAGINKNRCSPKYSPKGVDEFESTNVYNNTKCDSRKEVRFRSESRGRSNQVFDDDTRTNQSSSLFHDDDTHTNQSSSLFEDDTRTDQSSLLFDDDTRTNQSSSIFHDDASESNFDEVSLESTTLDEGGTNAESESYLTPLDDGSSMSYVFELVDNGGKQRRKYQLGVGQNAATSKLRKGVVKTTTSASASEGTTSTRRRRRVTVDAPRGRRDKSSTDDSDFAADAQCPLLPDILEEVSGSYLDAKSALNQVLHAFFVSPDDIDLVADKLRDAKLELVEMYHDRYERS